MGIAASSRTGWSRRRPQQFPCPALAPDTPDRRPPPSAQHMDNPGPALPRSLAPVAAADRGSNHGHRESRCRIAPPRGARQTAGAPARPLECVVGSVDPAARASSARFSFASASARTAVKSEFAGWGAAERCGRERFGFLARPCGQQYVAQQETRARFVRQLRQDLPAKGFRLDGPGRPKKLAVRAQWVHDCIAAAMLLSPLPRCSIMHKLAEGEGATNKRVRVHACLLWIISTGGKSWNANSGRYFINSFEVATADHGGGSSAFFRLRDRDGLCLGGAA